MKQQNQDQAIPASVPTSLHLISQSPLAIFKPWKNLSHCPKESSGRLLILQIIPFSVLFGQALLFTNVHLGNKHLLYCIDYSFLLARMLSLAPYRVWYKGGTK